MWNLGRNLKTFWRYVKSQLKSMAGHSFIINGSTTSDNNIIANAFSDMFILHFTPVNTADDGLLPPFRPNIPVLSDIAVTLDEVLSQLKNIKPNASGGPDGIPSLVLYKCAFSLVPSI